MLCERAYEQCGQYERENPGKRMHSIEIIVAQYFLMHTPESIYYMLTQDLYNSVVESIPDDDHFHMTEALEYVRSGANAVFAPIFSFATVEHDRLNAWMERNKFSQY